VTPGELQVRAVQKGAELVCVVGNVTHSNGSDFIRCVVRSSSDEDITVKVRGATAASYTRNPNPVS